MHAFRLCRTVARVLLASILSVGLAPFAMAQEDVEELVVGWTDIVPFYQIEADGNLSGFVPELSRLLAEEIGTTVRFVRYNNIAEIIEAQLQGETNIVPGAVQLGPLQPGNEFTDRVGSTRVRLAVHTDRLGDIDPDNLQGLKVGIIPPTVGSNIEDLNSKNTTVPFSNFGDAIIALLAKRIDAISTVDTLIYATAQRAQLDHKLSLFGPTFQEFERRIAVRNDSSALVPLLNDAIARLEADGRLPVLRRRFFIDTPEPAGDVLTVGVANFPPYSVVEDDGNFSGYSVEVLQALAKNAGLKINFQEIDNAAWAAGPQPDSYDVLPDLTVTDARRGIMDFTLPTEVASYPIFVRSGQRGISGLESLQGRKVAVLDAGFPSRFARESGLNVIAFAKPTQVLDALVSGDVDAAIYVQRAFAELAEQSGMADEIAAIEPPLVTTERAIGLRFGLGAAREQLNAQIPAFLLSQDFRNLRQKYFGNTPFWNAARVRLAAIIAMIAGLFLLAFTYVSQRARRKSGELQAHAEAVSSRLAAVMDAAESGILGFDRDKKIAVTNPKALHILGGQDRQLPFIWPDEIKFIDPEDMKPFEASANPINRALAGQTLKAEAAIMTRNKGFDPRYVRLSSANLQEQSSPEIGTVIIIDDVSEQERNRQQVERSSRLDALGQLTGGIAHDFNNLLATIEYAIQLAQGTDEPETRLGYHTTALNSVRRGANLTNRLLAFAKRQPGLAKSAMVEDVLAEFAELARPTIQENITLGFRSDDPDLWVFCDVAQLENALLNLLLNSRDAITRSGQGDSIVIKARGVAEIEADSVLLEEDPHSYIAKGLHREHAKAREREDGFAYRYIEIAVTDNGPGMSEEVMRRAIDPFFTTKDTNSGTGLGLSMVYGFVQQANGELRIYSEVGHGTTVRILLPRGTSEGEREDPVERQQMPRGTGQTVLIVEDEDALLTMMRDIIGSLGYKVETASNGRDALSIVTAGKTVDLLLTDVVMPGGLGGFDLARTARQMRADLPVIYMSGYTGFSTDEMGEVVAPLIQKPSPPAVIARAIHEALTGIKPS